MGAAHGKTKEAYRIHSKAQKEKGSNHLFCCLSTLLDLPQETSIWNERARAGTGKRA